jgi:dihydroorotate dehydrogenase
MAFTGKNTVKSKIIINDQILQQVTYFKYLVCNISCKHDHVTREKLQALQVMYSTLNRVLKNKT